MANNKHSGKEKSFGSTYEDYDKDLSGTNTGSKSRSKKKSFKKPFNSEPYESGSVDKSIKHYGAGKDALRKQAIDNLKSGKKTSTIDKIKALEKKK